MKTTNLRWMARNMDYLRVPLNGTERAEMQGSIPYWGANGVVDYVDASVLDERVILVGEDGAPFFERDKDVAFISEGAAWINNHIHILKPDPRLLEDRFLKYFLNQVDYSLYINGSTRDKLTQSQLGNISVSYPDLETQHQIADFLDRETARIDLLIEKKQRFLDLLTEKRFATTSSLLTGEMFSSQEQKACSIPWLDSIPSDWIEARMKDVCTQIIDCKNRTPEPVEDGMYLVVRTTCVRDGKFNEAGGYFTNEASYREWTKRGRPQENDVIFTREAPVGEACLAPTDHEFCLGQRTMIYRPNLKKVLPEYIVETIYSSIGKSYIGEKGKGSTVGHLRVPEVYNFPCLLPPLPIQREILAELDRRTGHFVALQKATLSSIDRLKEYRSALITAAVTGQIDVASHSRSGATERRLDALQEEMGA